MRELTAGEERTGRTSPCQFAKRLQTARLMTRLIVWEDSELHRRICCAFTILLFITGMTFLDRDDDRIVLAVRCRGEMARSIVVVDVACYL